MSTTVDDAEREVIDAAEALEASAGIGALHDVSKGSGQRRGDGLPAPHDAAEGSSVYSVYSVQANDDEELPWEDPLPLRCVDLPPPFPADALPGWLRAEALGAARSIQVPIDLPAMIGLCALATACQGWTAVTVWEDWIEPVNLYALVVLPSGERKTAALREMAAPIEAYEKKLVTTMRAEIAEQASARKILEQRLQDAERTAAKASMEERDVAKADAMYLATELATTPVPSVPQYIADDATPEALARLLAEQNGRIAVWSDEADPLDIAGGRYAKDGEPNLGVLLKGHAGSSIRINRVGKPPVIVEQPALTLALSPQPEVLAGLTRHGAFRGRGLLARILYSQPRSIVGSRTIRPAPVPDSVRRDYHTTLTRLLELGRDAETHQMRMTPAAQQRMERFSKELEPRLGKWGDLAGLADWAGKLAGAVARVAGLLHLADYAQDPRPWEPPIGADTVGCAIMIGEYLLGHAMAAFAAMGADPLVEKATAVADWLHETGLTEVTKRSIHTAHRSRFRRAADIEPVLALLIEHGYLREIPATAQRGKAGRPGGPIYRVSPLLDATQNTHNTQNPPAA